MIDRFGTGVNAGSIDIDFNTANGAQVNYDILAQSTSAQVGVTGALTGNNGVRLIVADGMGKLFLGVKGGNRIK